MLPTKGYAAMAAKEPLEPFSFERRDIGPHDVLIAISHCGICHSDIHQARDEWGISLFPMVPGHEIVGTVAQVGTAVSTFKTGDRAGVGCFVDSCRTCGPCREGLEQYCDGAPSGPIAGKTKQARSPKVDTPPRSLSMSGMSSEFQRRFRWPEQRHCSVRALPPTPPTAMGHRSLSQTSRCRPWRAWAYGGENR